MTKLFLIFVLLFSSFSYALEIGPFGASLGVRRTSVDADAGDEEAGLGLQFGMQKNYYLYEELQFRTGVNITQRYFEVNNTDFEFIYVDVPLALQYEINKKWSTFFGIIIGLNLVDDAEGSANPDTNTFITQLYFGGKYSVDKRLALEPYLEFGGSSISDDGLDNSNAIGVNLVYWFP